MKKRRLLLALIVTLLSSTVVFAASINGTFAGLPIANVKVNNEVLKADVPGVVLQGRTLLPARAIAESLNAVVTWNQATMTATISKPEIGMCFVDDINENADGTWDLINPYGLFDVGQGQEVIVYYEIGPMEKKLYEYRILVKEPNGDVVKASEQDSFEIGPTGMVGFLSIEDLSFKRPGNYKFDFQFKYSDGFKTVESKTLIVE